MKTLFKHSIYAFTTLFLLAGCTIPRIIGEYRIDVQQGNVVTREMVAQLKPGLTKDQVRFILGSPLLTDTFHSDRWDYVFRLRKGRTDEVENQQLSIYFDKNGKLEQYVGNTTLTEEIAAGERAKTNDEAAATDSETVAADNEVIATDSETAATDAENTVIGDTNESSATDGATTDPIPEDKPSATGDDAAPKSAHAPVSEPQNENTDKPAAAQDSPRTQQNRRYKEINLGNIDEDENPKDKEDDSPKKTPTVEDSWLWNG